MARKQGNPDCIHTVEAGDTLNDIAQIYWEDGSLWNWIIVANRGVVPDNLQVGQKLRIMNLSMAERGVI